MGTGLVDGFDRSLRMLQMAVSAEARDRGWKSELTSVVADLKAINHDTEEGFMGVSSRLGEFLLDSRKLHAEIDALTAMMAGEQAQDAGRALESVRNRAQVIERRSTEGLDALRTLQGAAARIRTGFSSFEKIALSFHITAVLARIETAHISASLDQSHQDLGNLAGEVLTSSKAIQDRAKQILEAATGFDKRVAEALGAISSFESLQLRQLPELLSAVDADLQAVESRRHAAISISSAIGADLTSLIADLNRVATSVQFHDITRQQIEHVYESLEALLAKAPAGALSPEGAELIRLQRAQLLSAARSFSESATRIERDLQGVAAHAARMADASRTILGSDNGASFLGEMRRRFETILSALEDFRRQEGSTVAVIAELANVTGELRQSISELRSLEFQLGRIALNAAISASHLGTVAAPLNVVASAMQSLQLECSARSSDAESAMEAITEAARRVGNRDAEEEAGGAGLTEELKRRVDELDAANGSSEAAAAAVSQIAQALLEKLTDARARMSVIGRFQTTVDSCVAAFERIANEARPVWALRRPEVALPDANHYTMEAERHVHQAVATGDTATAAATVVETADDVEFF